LLVKREALTCEGSWICSFLDTVLCGPQKILVVLWRLSSEACLMVEFVIRVNQQRTAYIPKEIVENFGYDWTLVPNARTAVIYPRQCSLDTAIKSLQIILDGLKLRLTAQKGELAT